MIELALHNQLDSIYVEDLAGGTKRIHLGTNHSSHQMAEGLADQLDKAQITQARDLLANDGLSRSFERQNDYVIIRPAS